jgi:glycosyltransferase involved in cell wall biosynthesis
MKFSLVHPSRGRPGQALQCLNHWWTNFSKQNELEYILSVDTDDVVNYLSVIPQMHRVTQTKICVKQNRSVVPALNVGAKLATGDVLIYLSDDFICPKNWDLELQKAVGNKKEFAIWVNDGLQDRIMTIHMLSRAYYERLGYMYFPEYYSVYVDNDLTEQVKKDGVMVNARHLLFKHNHYSVTGKPPDATYLKENHSEAYRSGKALFQKRWPGVQV